MGKLSVAVANKMLDHILKTTPFSVPTDIYIGLWSGDPEGAGTECSGATYARVVANGWTTAAARAISNEAKLEFPEAGADWGNVDYVTIHDAITGGNLLGKDDISSVAVNSGDNLYIAIGDIDVSIVAGGIGNTWANSFLDHIFKNSELTVSTNLYVGYATATPADDASGLAAGEPSGNGYARELNNAWDVAVVGLADNTGAILFDACVTAIHGDITHFFISDSLTLQAVANLIFHGALDATVSIGIGDQLNFPIGDLDIEIDGA